MAARAQSCGRPDRRTTTGATTSSTTPRSPTPSTTRWSASCASSRRSTPSSSRPTRRPSGRRRAVTAVRAGRAPRADDVARQRVHRDELHGVGRALQRRLIEGDGRRRRLRVRAEDRRPRHLASATRTAATCRPPPGATAASARTSPPTCAPSPTCPRRCGRRARPTSLEVRGEVYMPLAAFEALNERQVEAGGRLVRQPPQLGGRLAAPEGPVDHAPAASCRSGRTSSARSRAGPPFATPLTRRSTSSRELGLPVNPEITRARPARRGATRYCRDWQEHRHDLTTRSTAWS